MKFSVLTPSFNQGQFIASAMNSIADQSNSLALEVLVADALSTDNTLRVLQGFQETNTFRLSVVSEADTGPANALNKAFSRSSGEIIAWLNADDEYLPGAFLAVHHLFLAHPDVLMVYGQGQFIDESGEVLDLYGTSRPDVPIDRFQRGCFISQPTVFMRRELLQSIGPFNESFKSAFDLEYWLRVFLSYQDRVGFIDQVLASTRLHSNTITSRQRETGALEAMRALKQHLGYVESNWARSHLNELRSACEFNFFSEQAQAFLNKTKPLLTDGDWVTLQKEFLSSSVRQEGAVKHTNITQFPVLPWLARLIYGARVDLRQKMDIATPQGYWSYCAWLVRSAINANKSLCRDTEFLQFCVETRWPSTNLSLVEAVIYQAAPMFAQQFPLPPKAQEFQEWVASNRNKPVMGAYRAILDAIENRAALGAPVFQIWSQNPVLAKSLPAGFNVIGYVQTQSGIGEDARTTFDALRKQGHNCSLIDFKPGDPIPQNVHSHDSHLVQQGPYATNLICLPATELVRYAVTDGLQQMQGRYNIGYWPWELNGWPKAWAPIQELVDEVWVASHFIKNSIGNAVQKPIKVVPLNVELGPIAPLSRKDFGLPESAKLFCFAFDLNSSIHRKNPHDCLKMFLQSFPLNEGWSADRVGLVIKTHQPAQPSADWEQLKALAATDPRIYIFEKSFFRPDLLALYNVCDCFLSLHRAEGYGRNIAEAILLGLEVVTTGYSGNLDFCFSPQCSLVDCDLIPVQSDQYPDGEGLMWAGNFKLPKLDGIRRRFSPKLHHTTSPVSFRN